MEHRRAHDNVVRRIVDRHGSATRVDDMSLRNPALHFRGELRVVLHCRYRARSLGEPLSPGAEAGPDLQYVGAVEVDAIRDGRQQPLAEDPFVLRRSAEHVVQWVHVTR